MRPTAVGWRVIVLAGLLVAGAYRLGSPALAVLGLGALLAVAAGVAAVAAAPTVEVSREVYPERVGRSEVAVGLVTTTNASGRRGTRMAAWDRCELRDGQRLLPVTLPRRLGPGQSETGYQLPTSRRGVITLGPMRVEVTDPLGLVRRRRAAGDRRTLWVHPRVHPFDLRSTSRSLDREGGGAETGLEGSVTFHSLREYVPGDDLRRVHWRSSARTGTLMVRQNVDVTRPEATVVLVTERSAYPDPDVFEHAVETAASVLAATADAQVPARLVTTGGADLAGRGSHDDVGAFLDELAAVGLADGGSLARTADVLRRDAVAGLLVVACGPVDAEDLMAVHHLAEVFAPAVVARFVPPSETATWAGAPGGSDRTTGDDTGGGAAPAVTRGAGVIVIDAGDAAEFCARWQGQRA